ncbi:MAG: transposase [Pseudanabaenaceae cyanobacterium]
MTATASILRQADRERGAEMLYLPPYSAEWNPIERVWLVLKY